MLDCIVVGAPDENGAKRSRPAFGLKPGQTVEPEALIALCKEQLGSAKAPNSANSGPSCRAAPSANYPRRTFAPNSGETSGARFNARQEREQTSACQQTTALRRLC